MKTPTDPDVARLCKTEPVRVMEAAVTVLADEIDLCSAAADRAGAPSMRTVAERVAWMADRLQHPAIVDASKSDPVLTAALDRIDTASTSEEYSDALSAFYLLASMRSSKVAQEAFEQLLRNLADRWRRHAGRHSASGREVLLGCAATLESMCSPAGGGPLLPLTVEQLDRALATDPFLARYEQSRP